MAMKSREVTVTSRVDGKVMAAEVILCPKCEGDGFVLYLVNGHNHLQCLACDETYCQGKGCEDEL